MNNYDYLVIGAGSGGVRFARLMGSKGFKVAIIEGDEIGGTCVIRGCIPKKLFIYATTAGRETNVANAFGWNYRDSDFDLAEFIEKKDIELQRLSNIYSNVLTNNNVKIIKGFASFSSENSIIVNDKEYFAKQIIIATGSTPRKLPVKGFEHTIDSNDFLNLNNIPKSALILGGGFSALEFTNILLALGVKVSIFIRSGRVLNSFDHEISDHIKQELIKQGVTFISDTILQKIEKNANGDLTTIFANDQQVTTSIVVRLVGRTPNVKHLNLEAAKVKLNDYGAIVVDDYFQTSNPNIFAIGDVIDKANLTPVATKQAMYLVNNLTSNHKKAFNYNLIPTAVFSYPEIAKCGLTEQKALEQGYKLDIYKSSFRPLKHTITGKDIKSFFKIIVNSENQKVLGIHICDLSAGEIIQGFAAALKAGITKPELDDVIGVHPSSAEELVTMYNKAN
ncbi:glutathione-disulfide reductase [Rickettsiales bacterium LUAb2]